MSDAVLESFTRQYMLSRQTPLINFTWQGGEPALMGLDFYRKAVAYQKKYARPGMTIENAFQTNGTLLDDAWCRFFHENNFLVGLSLDGPSRMHDLYRKDKAGRPTFDQVLRAVRLLQKHQIDFNILTCVSASNVAYPWRFITSYATRLGRNTSNSFPLWSVITSRVFKRVMHLPHAQLMVSSMAIF